MGAYMIRGIVNGQEVQIIDLDLYPNEEEGILVVNNGRQFQNFILN
jgi:hypothetical protein